jgi:hypothetical protein
VPVLYAARLHRSGPSASRLTVQYSTIFPSSKRIVSMPHAQPIPLPTVSATQGPATTPAVTSGDVAGEHASSVRQEERDREESLEALHVLTLRLRLAFREVSR